VKTFSFDTHEELAKILDSTGQAKDLNLIVRMGVQAEGAAYSACRASSASSRTTPRACCWPPVAPRRT
jgi:ornithine decarboxylase